MKIDVYAAKKSNQENSFCKIFVKSSPKHSKNNAVLLSDFKYLKTIDLKPDSIYIGLDIDEAIVSIERDGFYMSYCAKFER